MTARREDIADRAAIKAAALDPSQIKARRALAGLTAKVFGEVGRQLHITGHILGTDRRDGRSPFGHGNDAAVAVSMLLRIGSQLVSASADLIEDGRAYAGAALIRQLVEIEYLAWAFETNDRESARWLRSNSQERRAFFTPAKLRNAAGGRFRGIDYGYHCELGGHPVPGSWVLLHNENRTGQLMLSDCLGHAGRIWDHIFGWTIAHGMSDIVQANNDYMVQGYKEWKRIDALTILPPPPDLNS